MNRIPPTTVVIPTLNEERYLPRLLDSLTRTEAHIEVIVVDGQSEDKTREVAKSFESRFKSPSSIRTIVSERGISIQRNVGAALAQQQTLLFCDADVIFPSSESYTSLVRDFVEGHYAVATAPIAPIERRIGTRIAFGAFLLFQRFFLIFDRPYFGGSCLLTTAEVFKKIGGFDDSILLAEDVDYAFRAAKLGRSGLLKTSILVSARRFIQYGTLYTLKEWSRAAVILIRGGKVTPDKVFYPFGEYRV